MNLLLCLFLLGQRQWERRIVELILMRLRSFEPKMKKLPLLLLTPLLLPTAEIFNILLLLPAIPGVAGADHVNQPSSRNPLVLGLAIILYY